ncbi:rhamnogalacturonate lyase-like [Salvia splendens]|uniref:rhamnogalacturonate lyase-like n=1 Tax=Salvia splendens TaxID=180675 RepID=UPI001C27A746|nr:rhamnogalacturonate lyase-like [Salvia splendens]
MMLWVGMVLLSLFLPIHSQTVNRGMVVDLASQDERVTLVEGGNHVEMSNGIVSITLTSPGGSITNITYQGSDNLLQTQDKETDRGHWDVVWNEASSSIGKTDNLEGTDYKVISQSENQIEISFTRTWSPPSSLAPLNIDKRYVMLRGSPGFYTYAILERLEGWPSFLIQEGRIVFKLQENKFHYMAISDERQRFMPMYEDRKSGEPLAYKEAVLLKNATNPEFNGEVDDKYLYSGDNSDNTVHGWVSNDKVPIGFWMITPSNEFRTGGPIKQDLTSHTGPILLSMFISRHYIGTDIDVKFETQDNWKKVIGPNFIYLNSNASALADPSILWNDAKLRLQKEEADWPYNFLHSNEYLKSDQRGSITGQLLVHDRLVSEQPMPAGSAYVGLAPPGAAGSWQIENKGYQFWTRTNEEGNFEIKNVIPGTYNLFGWVSGVVGDFKHVSDIAINPGSSVKVENLVFDPPRNGPTLWEIGIPDRSAVEFFIPDPNPKFKLHPYKLSIQKFRQYGLWDRYTDLYPKNDLVFTIGTSNYKTDWFFAHVTRKMGETEYAPTTWQIVFNLNTVDKQANYTLQLSLASATALDLQVRFNDQISPPHFETGFIGRDNALARHGIRGLYRFYNIPVQGLKLVVGENKLFLTQANRNGSKLGPFNSIMYDYIRLEGPTPINVGVAQQKQNM